MIQIIRGNLPFSQILSGTTSDTITHNLGYCPRVWVLDANRKLLTCDVSHASDFNSFTLEFAEAQNGTVYYR